MIIFYCHWVYSDLINDIKTEVNLTCAPECRRAAAVIGEKHEHGLFALVVVAPWSKVDQFQVHLASFQCPNHHMEPQVAAFICHPGADLQDITVTTRFYTTSSFCWDLDYLGIGRYLQLVWPWTLPNQLSGLGWVEKTATSSSACC